MASDHEGTPLLEGRRSTIGGDGPTYKERDGQDSDQKRGENCRNPEGPTPLNLLFVEEGKISAAAPEKPVVLRRGSVIVKENRECRSARVVQFLRN